MPLVTGIRTTKNINQDQRKVDMADKIALLQPSKAPLVLLTKKIATKPTINPIFHWLEDDLQARWDAVNNATGYTNVDTAIVVDDGTLFNVGDIVKVPRTGEVMRVTAISTNTLTVVRGYGTTAAAALVDNDPLLIIGSAFKEGDLAAEATGTITSTVSNYTQIFRTSVKVTKTQEASELYGGSDRTYQRKKKGIEHAVDIERAAWFGEKTEKVNGAEIIRTTAGILAMISANASTYDASNALTEDNFEKEFLENLFKYGNPKKTMFCSSRVISVINSWGRHKLQTVVGEETYGLNVMRYISAHGELNLIQHPLFEGAVYGKMGVALDLENVQWRPLTGRDTKLNTNIQPNDADYYLDEYITEGGFMVKLPKTHGIVKNVDFPA
jgi:hypothetical protein